MTSPIKLAIVGVGKIVYDQHVPAIAANAAHFALVATASRNNTIDNIPSFPTIEAMLAARPTLKPFRCACRRSTATPPPTRRWPPARVLEKPPGATLSEVADLRPSRRSRA
jgi:D-galactose 1-dehydrogenase